MASSSASPGVIAQLSGRRSSKQGASASPSHRALYDDNTGSSFQPEHESTQQFDTATQDPMMQSHSENVSGRIPSYSDGDSIEIGRGVKRNARNSPDRFGLDEDMSESHILSLHNDSLYDISGTPPARPSLSARKSQEIQYNSIRKQASVRRATTAPQADVTKTSDTVPAKARSTGGLNRRTLSDMHAKVNAESESFIGHDRQAQSDTQKDRSTRFGKSRLASGEKIYPTRFTSGAGLDRDVDQTPRRTIPAPDAAFTGNQTAQSFMLPDLPNITELVSGVRKDGTPVFSRTTKNRSRFTSASYGRGANNEVTEHARLHSIPLPEEEKAIFASLQLLQGKVAQLELEKSEATQRVEEYENEVIQLRSQVQAQRRLRRPDSGLGSEDENSGKERRRAETITLQASLKATQDRRERSDRKQSVSDIAVKRISHERDALVTQLGVAFYSNEELKDENEQLRADGNKLQESNSKLEGKIVELREMNEDLRIHIERLEAQHKHDAQQWVKREAELKSRVARRVDTARETNEPDHSTRDVRKSSSGLVRDVQKAAKEQRRRSSGRVGQETQNNIVDRVEEEIRKARAEASEKAKAAFADAPIVKSHTRSQSQIRQTVLDSDRRGLKFQRHHPAPIESDVSDTESTTDLEITRPKQRISGKVESQDQRVAQEVEDTRDITNLSFLDPAELSRLRKTLEEERRASKLANAASVNRKPSLKDMTGRADNTGRLNVNEKDVTIGISRNVRIQSPHTSDAISYQEPDPTVEASMLSTSSRRPAPAFTEQTSAFIIPDITLHKNATHIPHNKATCTSCPHPSDTTLPIQMPVPVTERDMDETNATLRPAQPPTEALATVLTQLQDEITHLKLKLAALERVYSSHDPALGRRKRVAVKGKIENLLAEIEKRSEQVYRLYDVLEGQKSRQRTGAEMREGEVEETLQSLGIDVQTLGAKGGKTGAKKERAEVQSKDEMWEGLSGSEESVDLQTRR